MTSLQDFMGGIRQVESGGNYNTPPNRAGASGAYQFIDSTWGGYGGYAHAYQAPPEVQDAKAAELMQSYYDSFGSWDYVAAAWIGGPGTAAKGPGAWAGISDGNISVADYVHRVNAAMGSGVSSSAGLGAGSGAATTTPATTPPVTDPATPERVLTGAVGLFSGKSPDEQFGHLMSPQGDTLGGRLASILGVLGGGGSTSATPAQAADAVQQTQQATTAVTGAATRAVTPVTTIPDSPGRVRRT